MISGNRRERELRDRQAGVLLAAGRVFAQKGFERATMAEIAREAEVGVGTIYQLFESKDVLQMVLLDEKAGKLLAQAKTEARAQPGEAGGVQKLAGVALLLSGERPEIRLGQTLSRRELEAQTKREGILEAAARAFVEKGFHGAAMADIAKEAGVATGTLYNFFPSKEELYFTLVEEKADEFLLYLQAEVNQVPSVVEKVTRLIRAECAFFEANRAFFKIYISTRSGFEWTVQEDLGERIHDKYTVYLGWVAGIIEAGMQEGIFKAMEPKVMAQALVGMLNASVFDWMIDGEGPSLTARMPRIAELFLRGAQQP